MKGIGLLFFASGAVYGLAGMALGIRMGIAQDFTLAPAHVHLNLFGFVTMALMGVFYHLTPRAADSALARIHFALATVGIWTMTSSIALAVTGSGDALTIVGALVTAAGLATFLVNLGLTLRRPALHLPELPIGLPI